MPPFECHGEGSQTAQRDPESEPLPQLPLSRLSLCGSCVPNPYAQHLTRLSQEHRGDLVLVVRNELATRRSEKPQIEPQRRETRIGCIQF